MRLTVEALGIRRVLTHGEKAAAYMADGYAVSSVTHQLNRRQNFTDVDNAWAALTGDNNFFDTGIIFPVTLARIRVNGAEGRVKLPAIKGFTGAISATT